MNLRTLRYSPKIAEGRFSEMVEANSFISKLLIDDDEKQLRQEITDFCKKAPDLSDAYAYDVFFAVSLYTTLNKKPWFKTIDYANYDFWRRLSLVLIPDIVYARRGPLLENKANEGALSQYFYQKPVRIYPASCFWYAYIFWQGSPEDTTEFLSKKSFFTTDAIVASCERLGQPTFSREVYQQIFLQYTSLDEEKIQKALKKYKDMVHFLRAIFVQHTAKCLVFQPTMFKGGTPGYVNMLIDSVLGD